MIPPDQLPFFGCRHEPPVWDSSAKAWRVTRYADVAEAIRNPDLGRREVFRQFERLSQAAADQLPHLPAIWRVASFCRNPPAALRLRQFSQQALRLCGPGLAPATLSSQAHSCVQRFLTTHDADGWEQLIKPYPVHALGTAFGLSNAVHDGLQRLSLLQSTTPQLPLRELQRLNGRLAGLVQWVRTELARAPRSSNALDTSPLSKLIELNDQDFRFNDEELANALIVTIIAGTETTQCLLASGVLLVLSCPALFRLAADPAQRPALIHELLRVAPAIAEMPLRIASRDTRIGSRDIRRGEQVILQIGNAHHDPAAFVAPMTFNPARQLDCNEPLLAFGAGDRGCIGGNLAKAELSAMLSAVTQLLPEARTKPSAWRVEFGLCRPERLIIDAWSDRPALAEESATSF